MFNPKSTPATLAALIAASALLYGCAEAPPPAAHTAEARETRGIGVSAQPAPESAVAKSAPASGGDAEEASPGMPGNAPAPPPPMAGKAMEGAAGGSKPSAAPSPVKKDKGGGAMEEPKQQPGLGTEWGATRTSKITTSPFVRADPTTPLATASLFYNDEAGARALSGGAAREPMSGGMFSVAGGTVSIGLKDDSGRFFSAFIAGGRQVVVGSAGKSYTIVVKNNSANRFECILSVDGLDVLDGKTAAFTKRGYIVDARGQLEIEGFRQSADAVAAFRFGAVQSSYSSQKHGETRNVGVIGIALFNEQVAWNQSAVQKRRDANPFPGSTTVAP
jgi:hypothetical protein